MRIQEMQSYMRVAGYSPRTIAAYVRCVQEIGDADLLTFLDKLARRNRSSYTLNQYHAAYKFYKTQVLQQEWHVRFPYAKRHTKLPVVLSREDIAQILETLTNEKHRLLVALSYGAGLRVSEVVSLLIQDLNFNDKYLVVRGGKGNKDRVTLIPEKIIDALASFVADKAPASYVFASDRGGKLTTRTAQAVFENALFRAGIKSAATFHSLRHSFATHLLENGVDIRYIQKLLGHASISTTQLYTKVTNPQLKNIRSPL